MSEKRFWLVISLVSLSLVNISLGCDSSTAEPTDDAGGAVADSGADAADARDAADRHDGDAGDAEDAADADAGEQWPEQDQRSEQPLGADWQMPEADSGFSVLSANVGNIDVHRCNDVAYNLCWDEMEQTIADSIARLDPDIVLLQEVLTPEQCEAAGNPADDHVCHPDFDSGGLPQVRRLLGADYTIACDERRGYECVGVHTRLGGVEDCEPGELCADAARAAPVVEGCDEGFSISSATAQIGQHGVDLINAHPPSDASGAEDGQRCREAYLQHVFGADATLRSSELALVAGDFNFDPFRAGQDEADVDLWNEHVSYEGPKRAGDQPAFAYHSGIVEHDPPYWSAPMMETTLDHVISSGLIGRCVTLGAHPGYAPLDRGLGETLERLDHLGLWCQLDFAP
ncbi:MAG: endonuclease/exonuclease/phosphatase family protein [Persicimonas sp.]